MYPIILLPPPRYKAAILTDEEKILLIDCEVIAVKIATKHGLNFTAIEPIECKDIWGACSPDGILRLTFYKYIPIGNGRMERWTINKSEVLRTLGHELAHLRYGHHRADFWGFCNELIAEIGSLTGMKLKREQNCYRR